MYYQEYSTSQLLGALMSHSGQVIGDERELIYEAIDRIKSLERKLETSRDLLLEFYRQQKPVAPLLFDRYDDLDTKAKYHELLIKRT